MLIRFENAEWWKNFFAEAAAIAIDKGYMDDYVDYLMPGIRELQDLEDEGPFTVAMDNLSDAVSEHFKALFNHNIEEYV